MTLKGVGFTRSYLRRAFWRANATIITILGLLGAGVALLVLQALAD